MRVLLSGGTGLVGQTLTKELVARGYQVTILTRHPERDYNLPAGVNLVGWDGKSPAGWGELVNTSDAVINLAGASIAGENIVAILTRRWNDDYKRLILESRLNAGGAMTEAVRGANHKPKVFVQASAMGYYGPQVREAVDEQAPSGDDFMADVCQAWEDSTQPVEKLGVRRVILRSGLIMSTAGGILPIMLLPFRLFVGGPLGDGRQFISWIHIRDQVEAICFLLENELAHGPYNMTTPNPLTSAQFAKIAGRVLRRPSFFPVPGFAFKLVLGEKAALVLNGQLVRPKRLLEAGYAFKFPEMEEALRDLVQ